VHVRESRLTGISIYCNLWRRIKRSGWWLTDVTKEVGEFSRRGRLLAQCIFNN
jgi:hypothetical protein